MKTERVPLLIVFMENGLFKTELSPEAQRDNKMEYALCLFMTLFIEIWKDNIKNIDMTVRGDDDESIFS